MNPVSLFGDTGFFLLKSNNEQCYCSCGKWKVKSEL